jgi:hypothetical protein
MLFREAKNMKAKISRMMAAMIRQGTAPCRLASATLSRLVFLAIFFEAIFADLVPGRRDQAPEFDSKTENQ